MLKKAIGVIVTICLGTVTLVHGQAQYPKEDFKGTPIPMRLQQGSSIAINVDTDKVLRPTNRMCGGIAMVGIARWTGTGQPFSRVKGTTVEEKYSLHPSLEKAFQDLKLPLTRFYAVDDKNEPFKTIETKIDAIAFLLDKLKIPKKTTMLELEDIGANSTSTVETWVRAVKHSMKMKYGFKHWEIGNEVYSSIWGKHMGNAFPNPETYVQHFLKVAKAIKAVQPDALIGISVPRYNYKWGHFVLKSAAGHYDFICPHYYGGFGKYRHSPFTDVVITENHMQLERIQNVKAMLKAYNSGNNKKPFIYDSEWGLHMRNDNPKKRGADFQVKNGNIMGTVYRAVRMIYYAREDIIRGACGWKGLTRPANPGFATLFYTHPELRTQLFWLYYYHNNNLGKDVLPISGTVPYHAADGRNNPLTPLLATKDKNKVYLMMANGSWTKSFPANITLSTQGYVKEETVVLSDDNLKAPAHIQKKSDFVKPLEAKLEGGKLSFTLPPHSIVFIRLRK